MSERWIWIEPEDVWLFRDGRPFSAGEGHAARSLFPPTPHTVQGALRSAVLGESDIAWQAFKEGQSAAVALRQRIGGPDYRGNGTAVAAELGAFSMAGPFVARKKGGKITPCLPLPSDLLAVKDSDPLKFVPLTPTVGVPFCADWQDQGLTPLWPACCQDKETEPPEDVDWVLGNDGYDAYLQGDPTILCDVTAKQDEFRFGIQIDRLSGRPVESMLYQAQFIRAEDGMGLLARIADGIGLSDRGTLALGGEAHKARYCAVADDAVRSPARPKRLAKRFKLVLLTPAYFSGGWQPTGGDWRRLFGGQQVTLRSVALSRPQPIGGWDLAHQRAKPMRHLAPAGSVYFFQADAEIAPPAALTETPSGELDFDRLGFGQVACGAWTEATYQKQGGTHV